MIEQITWKNIYNMLLNEYIGVKKYRVHDSNFVRKINVYILSEWGKFYDQEKLVCKKSNTVIWILLHIVFLETDLQRYNPSFILFLFLMFYREIDSFEISKILYKKAS